VACASVCGSVFCTIFLSAILIKIQYQTITGSEGLTTQHKTARDFVIFERMIGIHVHPTLNDLAPTSRANAALAGVTYIDAMRKSGIKQRLTIALHCYLMMMTIDDETDLAMRADCG
jgi:hypothetical protein